MKAPTVIAIAVASAAFGSAATGWVLDSPRVEGLSPAVLSNTGYDGPASVPLGDLAGGAEASGAINMPNPLGNSPEVINQGHQLFMQMNCASCHGYNGVGGMGPPLNDHEWRYGGAPVQVYKTLFEGRPKGMPAWGVALPPDKLWAITAYVESLGGGVPPDQAVPARLGDPVKENNAREDQ